jgi:hypothetical protein
MLGDFFELAREAVKALQRIAEAVEDVAHHLDHWPHGRA